MVVSSPVQVDILKELLGNFENSVDVVDAVWVNLVRHVDQGYLEKPVLLLNTFTST